MSAIARSLRFAVAGTIALGSSLLFIGPVGAGANGTDFTVSVTPLFTLDNASFSFEVIDDACAGDTVVTVVGVPDATIDLTDFNSGTVHLPVGTAAGTYELEVECSNVAGAPINGVAFLEFHTVTIEKIVTGAAPADAQFAVTISCGEIPGGIPAAAAAADSYALPEGAEADGDEFMEADLTFSAAGGSTTLVGYQTQGCAVLETDDGGATTSSIVTEDCGDAGVPIDAAATEAAGASGTFEVFAPTGCTQTLTNDFVAAAPVVQAQPAFTG